MRFLAPLALVAIATAATPAPAATSADAAFDSIWQAEWAWRQSEGIADSGPGVVDDRLPDVSAAAHAKRLAYWQGTLAKLDAVDTKRLSPDTLIDWQVYRAQIAAQVDEEQFREWEKPLNGDSAFWSDLHYATRGDFTGGDEDYRRYLRWLADVPRYLGQQTDNMRLGLKRGFTPPAVIMQGREKAVETIATASDPTAVVYYKPFASLPASIPAARRAAMQAEARAIIAERIIPAHRTLLAFLRNDYFPGMTNELGATRYDNGAAYYRSRIRAFTTLDMTPDAIHALGLAEIAKIRAEMEQVKKDAKFDGDLPAFLKFLRTDPQFYPKTADELMKEAAWHAKRFDAMAGKWFGRLPRQRFAIIEVPPDIAPFYTAGRGGPGTYLVNTYNLPSRPLFQLPALTLHESAPGHAFQMPLSIENTSLKPFRRNSYISAFGEGWALYTERLGDEMGFYRTPYERFGMLSYQAWRAARLVIDTGIHAKGWTREQALQYFRENTALSEHEITTEVDRYIGWPGQALSYYLGQLAIQRTRAKAEKSLGDKFDIRNFHDMVLSLGSVPIPVLEARVDRFIAEGGPSPYPKEPAA
ncbi:Uncharacterized conserved protein, DUF885 familyt [Sphingomonas sp. OV641]|uniref:DUF885 domain-containing protein n=1 Tax=Sphingomonas sp. OV641 TaxID=1881068 RepID=UPI0008B3590E|nr:DUF885 family protein [Sphingomonas sp. OV641]SEJ06745.1 Uncharacterized conserved protein, DUF885 familyt [Sphingomonas sp. OV641]